MQDVLLWITAVGAVATAVFTGLLWFVGWRTLGGARDQLKLLREQAERDGRPYVVVDAVPGLQGPGSWDLVVQNAGRSAARRVCFVVDEWEPRDDGDHITAPLMAYLAGEHTMIPRARHRLLWRNEASARWKTTVAGADPTSRVRVEYQDDLGNHYSDEFSLDLDLLGHASPAPTEGPTRQGRDAELINIEYAVRTLATHVAELRR